jgi:hypothetical protein
MKTGKNMKEKDTKGEKRIRRKNEKVDGKGNGNKVEI